jgi:hypothetical protein
MGMIRSILWWGSKSLFSCLAANNPAAGYYGYAKTLGWLVPLVGLVSFGKLRLANFVVLGLISRGRLARGFVFFYLPAGPQD